jgi:hypothetical protein
MIATLQAAGRIAPTEWDLKLNQYTVSKQNAKKMPSMVALQDALMIKPGSMVEDIFLTLKRLGTLSGEFV